MRAFLGLLFVQMMACFNKAPSYLLSPASIRVLMANLHPTVCSPTIEHCVPRSHYREGDDQILGRDMHALICVPESLNSHRSNYRLVDVKCTEGWKAVGQGVAFRHDRRRLFLPPPKYRGAYARSIGYFVLTYPSYADLVHSKVLDLELLVEWSGMYPCTHVEAEVHATIASIQKNKNPFVTNPAAASRSVLKLVD